MDDTAGSEGRVTSSGWTLTRSEELQLVSTANTGSAVYSSEDNGLTGVPQPESRADQHQSPTTSTTASARRSGDQVSVGTSPSPVRIVDIIQLAQGILEHLLAVVLRRREEPLVCDTSPSAQLFKG